MNKYNAKLENNPAGYNGWKNREMWAFNLWISNDLYTYEMMREMEKKLVTRL